MSDTPLVPAPSAPLDVGETIAAGNRPLLIGLDVDGVLAPIVDHADDASLTPGINAALERLADADGVHVTVLSGRPIADLLRFDFPPAVELIGSHGGERQGAEIELDGDESRMLRAAGALAGNAADQAGEGAWVEHKPAGVVLHVREADDDTGNVASDWLRDEASTVDGLVVKSGSSVVELLVRHADKGTALLDCGARTGAATTVFIGDDVTDEDALAVLGATDVGIKVGTAPTCATVRLATTDDVLVLLTALADSLDG